MMDKVVQFTTPKNYHIPFDYTRLFELKNDFLVDQFSMMDVPYKITARVLHEHVSEQDLTLEQQWEKTDHSAPLPVSNISHASSTFNLTSTPTITFSPSSSDDVIRYEASIGTSPGSQDVLKWKTIGTATSFSLTSLTLQQGTTYYVNLTAVDSSENVSDVESSSGWVAGGGQMAVNLEYTYSKPNTATSGTGGSHYTSYCNLNDTVWNTCNISTSVGFSKKSSIDSAFSSCSRSFNNTTGVYNITCSPSVNCYYESAYPCVKYCPRVNVYVNVGGTALDGNCTFNPP
jgi:hypothetical protein